MTGGATSMRGGDTAAPVGLPPWRSLVLADGAKVVARTAPGETPVLLLHGWALTADVNFLHLIRPVAEQYGVVAMDMRGHGRGLPLRSDERFDIAQCADDAAAVLDTLGVDQVVVCGYSLGGPVGLEFARRHRDRVAGLVFAATALSFDSRADKMGRIAFRALRPIAHRSMGIGRCIPLQYFRKARKQNRQIADSWAWLRGELARCHPRVIVDVILAEYAFDFRPHLPSIAGLPAAVVVTARDGAVPPKDQRELGERLGATVIELDNGHEVFLTDPEVYVGATLDAIEQVLRTE